MNNEKNKNNIFEEASKEAAKQNIIKVEDSKKDLSELEDNNKKIALYISENPGKEFAKLQEAIEGPFAEKFMKIMNGLGDRDFMRYYLKTLEYFKPKVTRVEPVGDVNKEDNVIQVNIMQVNENGEIKTLTITDNE